MEMMREPGIDDSPTAPPKHEGLSADEVRRRAYSGSLLLTAKAIVLQGIALAATVVIVRALEPREIGMVAFGLTFTTFLGYLSGGQGLAGALIRSHREPTRYELETVLGLQIVVTIFISALAAALAWPWGEAGQVTALMLAALPLSAARVPGAVLLERRMAYQRIVAVEAIEMCAYQAWAVTTVLAGWGVWGLASAVVVRFALGSCLMLALSPMRIFRPRISLSESRRLIAFGSRVQGTEVVYGARDQGLNFITAAVAGLSTLGLWSLANRGLQVPMLLFNSLLRVSFPAMSRIVALGQDPAPLVRRALTLGAVGTGVILAPLAATAPVLIDTLFGRKWHDAAIILPPACLGLVVATPVSIAVIGYLWAVGDARTPLRASTVNAVVIVSTAALLLPLLGPVALGLAILAGAVADVLILVRGLAGRIEIRLASAVLTPMSVWAAAVGGSWLLVVEVVDGGLGLVVGTAVSEAAFLGGLFLFWHAGLAEAVSVVRNTVRGRSGKRPSSRLARAAA